MRNKTSRTVLAAIIAGLILALSLFGALAVLPQWVRGVAQAIGTLAGIYLGAQLQLQDQRQQAQGAAKSSVLHLVALAKGLQALLASANDVKLRMRESPPKNLDSYQNALDGYLAGIDAQARSLLAQAEAATASWYPFLAEDDPFLRDVAAGSSDEPHVDPPDRPPGGSSNESTSNDRTG